MIILTDKIPNIAKVNMESGNIYLNKNVFPKLPLNYQKFLLQHELGHLKLNTDNEILADNYAFSQTAGKSKFSLKDSVSLLADMLSFREPEHYERLKTAIIRAAKYDYQKNGNTNALTLINNLEKMKNTFIFPAIQKKEAENFNFPTIEPADVKENAFEGSPLRLALEAIKRKMEEKNKETTDNTKPFEEVIDHARPNEEFWNNLSESEGKEGLDTFNNGKGYAGDKPFAGEELDITSEEELPPLPPEPKKDKGLVGNLIEKFKTNDTLKLIAVAVIGFMAYKLLK